MFNLIKQEINMGIEIEYKCKCGYEHFESDGGSVAEFMLEETSCCKSCGFTLKKLVKEVEVGGNICSEYNYRTIVITTNGNDKAKCPKCNKFDIEENTLFFH